MVKVKVHFEELLSSLNSNWLHLFEGPLIYAHWPHNAAAHAFAKLVPTVVSTRSNAVSHYSHCLFNVKNWKVLVIGRFCRCRMGLTTMHSWCSPMARVWQRQLAQFSIWKHPLGGPNTTTVTFLRGNQRCAFDWISNKDVLLWLLFQTKASKYRVKYEKYCSQLFFLALRNITVLIWRFVFLYRATKLLAEVTYFWTHHYKWPRCFQQWIYQTIHLTILLNASLSWIMDLID